MLNLPQSFFLLAIDDASGKLIPSTSLRFGLIGAVLVELALHGRVGLDDEASAQTKRLQVIDRTPTGDEILDEELEKIYKFGRPKKISTWVNALGQKTLRKQIADSLVHEGVVVKEGKCFRWVIPSPVFPEQNASAKYWVKQRLRGIVLALETPEPRMLALLSLLRACRLLNLVFTKDERGEASKQVEKLVKGDTFGKAMGQAVEEIGLAVAESVLGNSSRR